MSADEAAAKAAYLLEWKRSRVAFYTKKQGLVGAALASTMRSIASAVPPPAAASTNEAAAKVNRLRVRLGPGPVTAALATMASAAPAAAVMSTDEAAAKAAYLARLDAEPPFYTKKQVVAGATLASTMRSIASMASAMPLPAATSTDEQLPKPLVLLERKRSRLSTPRSK